MKKTIALFLTFIMSCFLIGTKAFAEQGYISSTATSQVELTPDTVTFNVEIITTSKESMSKAIAENKRISTKVYENLKKATEKNKADSLKTLNYSAVPVYKYNNNKKSLDYYQVTNNVKVQTKQIANAGQMIDTAMSNGATSINNVSYDISNYEAECNKLLAETSKKAKLQAENIVSSLGTTITGIKSVDSSCSIAGKSTMPRLYMSAKTTNFSSDMEMGATSGTNIEVGTMTLNARVNICFYVK